MLMSIFIQIVVCLSASIWTVTWQNYGNLRSDIPSNAEKFGYLGLSDSKDLSYSIFYQISVNFGKWFLIMMNFVSISLLVSLEMVKFVQGVFMESDWMMYDENKDMPAKV